MNRVGRMVSCQRISKGVAVTACVLAAIGTLFLGVCDATGIAEDQEYLLDVGDVIEIAVWRNPELSKTVTIRPDGRISLPLAGEIKAAGMTPHQLSTMITASLGQTFIKDPKVTVIVDEVGSKPILVLGEVRSPGLYSMARPLTTLMAIGQAGGYNRYARLDSTLVVRNSQAARPNLYLIDLRKVLKKGGADNFALQPGDIVFVPKTFLGKVDDVFSFFAQNIKPVADTYLFYKIAED